MNIKSKFNCRSIGTAGYTLIETLVVLGIVVILAGIAAPSLFQLNKPLKTATLALDAHLSLIRAKAVATGQAYRLVMKYPVAGGHSAVEDPKLAYLQAQYAPTCFSPATSWKPANELDLQLPDRVNVVQHDAMNSGDICYDRSGSSSVGILYQGANLNDGCDIFLRDFNSNSKANVSQISLMLGGRREIYTYRFASPLQIVPLDSNDNAVF